LFGCLLLFQEELLEMVKAGPSLDSEEQAIDELLQEVRVKVRIYVDNVLHQPGG
jgi:hypothetical protein